MPAFDPSDLRVEEEILVLRTWLGEVACFRSAPKRPVLRAALVRHSCSACRSLTCPGSICRLAGIRVRGAAIDGPLDLAGFAVPGQGLPTLLLEDCDIPCCVDLRGSRLASLSPRGSRIRHVVIHEADIEWPVCLSGVRPCR